MADGLCLEPHDGKVYVSTNSRQNSFVEYDPVTGRSSVLVMVARVTSCAFGTLGGWRRIAIRFVLKVGRGFRDDGEDLGVD